MLTGVCLFSSEHKLTRDDAYLVLSSDGMWDVMSNEDVAQLLNEFEHLSAQELSNKLIDKALQRHTHDNMSVVVRLSFRGFDSDSPLSRPRLCASATTQCSCRARRTNPLAAHRPLKLTLRRISSRSSR